MKYIVSGSEMWRTGCFRNAQVAILDATCGTKVAWNVALYLLHFAQFAVFILRSYSFFFLNKLFVVTMVIAITRTTIKYRN